MIVCIAANTSIDRVLEVERLSPGAIHRPSRVTAVAGGKGLNVARSAASLGGSVRAVALLGGFAGQWIAEQLAVEDVETRIVWRAAETRTCVSVYSAADGQLTEFYESGAAVPQGEWTEFERVLAEVIGPGDIVTLSGSLPPGVAAQSWARVAALALGSNARILADVYGPALRETLATRPSLVKVNAAEATEATGVEVQDRTSAARAVRALVEAGAQAAVITLGGDGAVGGDASGTFAYGVGPRGKFPVGSGDAFLAGVAVALERREALVDAVRLGSAAAAANAAVPGPGRLDPGVLDASLQQVHLDWL